MKSIEYTNGKYRTVDIPGIGSYDLVSGQGWNTGEYAKSAWAFRCMQIRAIELAALPWRVTRNGEMVEEHEVIDWLNGFGPEGNFTTALIATELDLCLTGAAYWLIDQDRLARLNPNTVKVQRTKTGITGFSQTIQGVTSAMFPREEVIYFREFHPQDDLGPGIAIIKIAENAILTEYESSRYVKAFFENDAMPGLLLSTDQTIQRTAITELLAWWTDKFGGARKHHKAAFLDKGFKATVLSSNLREMALQDVRDQARRDICTAFGVPMILVGSMDEATYANAQEARKHLLIDVIIPRAGYYASVINEQFVSQIDPSVKFEFATEELSILQEDTNAKAERLGKLLEQGVIDAKFVREELGFPETARPSTPPPAPAAVPAEAALRAWQRKAMRAFQAGKPANVPFLTEDITPARQEAIDARLASATSEQMIREAFHDA